MSLPPRTVKALRVWKAQCKPGDLCFPTSRGTIERHSSVVETGLITAWRRAGITDRYSGLHALRHYAVSWWIARTPVGVGLSLHEASKLAGHSSIKITADRYAHLLPRDDDHASMAAAESRFG